MTAEIFELSLCVARPRQLDEFWGRCVFSRTFIRHPTKISRTVSDLVPGIVSLIPYLDIRDTDTVIIYLEFATGLRALRRSSESTFVCVCVCRVFISCRECRIVVLRSIVGHKGASSNIEKHPGTSWSIVEDREWDRMRQTETVWLTLCNGHIVCMCTCECLYPPWLTPCLLPGIFARRESGVPDRNQYFRYLVCRSYSLPTSNVRFLWRFTNNIVYISSDRRSSGKFRSRNARFITSIERSKVSNVFTAIV